MLVTLTATPSDESVYVSNRLFDDLDRMEDLFKNADLRDKLKCSLKSAVGDDGVKYENVDFIVSSRYTVNGELWIVGSMFKINITAMIATLHEKAAAWA